MCQFEVCEDRLPRQVTIEGSGRTAHQRAFGNTRRERIEPHGDTVDATRSLALERLGPGRVTVEGSGDGQRQRQQTAGDLQGVCIEL